MEPVTFRAIVPLLSILTVRGFGIVLVNFLSEWVRVLPEIS